MLDLTQDIQSLTTFRRRSADFLKATAEEQAPRRPDREGKSRRRSSRMRPPTRDLLDIAAAADAREGIRQGLEQSRKGQGQPAREFFREFESEIKKKHGLSR